MRQSLLLVEDNPEDYEATIRSFRRSGVPNPIVRCEDGEEAMDFLCRRGRFTNPEDAPRPALILLDLNLPGTDGRVLLSDIKRNPSLRKIPVVVLTTSSDPRDIECCYAAGANSYIQKPLDPDGMARAVARLKEYWFDIVILPHAEVLAL